MRRKPSIYDEANRLTHAYFGPDAAKHMGKFIEAHLRKPAEQLTRDELISLTDWIKNTASFLADDQNQVAKYMQDLLTLAENDAQYQIDASDLP